MEKKNNNNEPLAYLIAFIIFGLMYGILTLLLNLCELITN